VLTGMGGMTSALAGAPWWAVVGCLATSLAVAALHACLPQESAHRLAWWRLWWRHRHQRNHR